MGHNTANGAGDNEPEDDPKPFTKHGCPLGDGSLSHFLGFYLSDSVIRHAFPASEGAAIPLETAGFTCFVPLIPDTLGKFTISSEKEKRRPAGKQAAGKLGKGNRLFLFSID